MRTFYEQPGVVKATTDGETVVVSWENLGPHDFIRPCCEAQARQVQMGARYLVLDTAGAAGVVSQEDQSWFGDTLFPRFGELGLRAIVTIVPKNAISRLSSQSWKRTASPFPFEMYEATSVDDARRLVTELKQKAA